MANTLSAMAACGISRAACTWPSLALVKAATAAGVQRCTRERSWLRRGAVCFRFRSCAVRCALAPAQSVVQGYKKDRARVELEPEVRVSASARICSSTTTQRQSYREIHDRVASSTLPGLPDSAHPCSGRRAVSGDFKLGVETFFADSPVQTTDSPDSPNGSAQYAPSCVDWRAG